MDIPVDRYRLICKQLDIIKPLILNPNYDPAFDNNFLICRAIQENCHELVKLLLPRVDPSKCSDSFLHACESGHTEVVTLLLRDGRIDPSFGNNSCFLKACDYGHEKTALALIRDPRVDPSVGDNIVFRRVNFIGFSTLLEMLLKESQGRFDPSKHDNYCLCKAVRYGKLDVIGILCKDSRVDKRIAVNSMFKTGINKDGMKILELLLWEIMKELYMLCEMISKTMDYPKDVMRIIQKHIMMTEMR